MVSYLFNEYSNSHWRKIIWTRVNEQQNQVPRFVRSLLDQWSPGDWYRASGLCKILIFSLWIGDGGGCACLTSYWKDHLIRIITDKRDGVAIVLDDCLTTWRNFTAVWWIQKCTRQRVKNLYSRRKWFPGPIHTMLMWFNANIKKMHSQDTPIQHVHYFDFIQNDWNDACRMM